MGERYRSFGMLGHFKTECSNGHDLTLPDATYEYDHPVRGKIRQCKTCVKRLANERARHLAAMKAAARR